MSFERANLLAKPHLQSPAGGLNLCVKFACLDRPADGFQGLYKVIGAGHLDRGLALGEFQHLGAVAYGHADLARIAHPPPGTQTLRNLYGFS